MAFKPTCTTKLKQSIRSNIPEKSEVDHSFWSSGGSNYIFKFDKVEELEPLHDKIENRKKKNIKEEASILKEYLKSIL